MVTGNLLADHACPLCVSMPARPQCRGLKLPTQFRRSLPSTRDEAVSTVGHGSLGTDHGLRRDQPDLASGEGLVGLSATTRRSRRPQIGPDSSLSPRVWLFQVS